MYHEPRDLLIECKSCGVESSFSNYLPETPAFCNQCRERLIDLDLNDTHDEYVCEDCGFTMLLLKEAPFEVGESTCRCGSAKVEKMDSSSIAEDAEEAGAFDVPEEEEEEIEEDEEKEEEEEELKEVDWFRSDPDGFEEMDDYNETFDNDPGYN